MNRETIFAALFAKAQGAANFTLIDRKLMPMGEVPDDQCPALFQLQDDQDVAKKRGIPDKYTLRAEWWVYATLTQSGGYASTALNNLLDALETALAPDPVSGVYQLGLPDTVSDCRIEGKIQIFEGILGNKCMAIVPVIIVAT
jgi:hypothetical protein